MPHRVEIQHNKASLRKRLLAGSTGLSMLLIGVLCYLGHGILIELETDFEKQYFDSQMPFISTLASQPAINKKLMPDAVMMVKRGPVILYQKSGIADLPDTLAANAGEPVTEFNNLRLYIRELPSTADEAPLTVIWRTKDLTEISSQIVNTLSVAGFITFWVAVWAALLMSAFIARRFEQANNTLERLALEDALTKLPNRNALLSGDTFNSTYGALFFLDLDRFREINDALGHAMGDRMLFAFSQRLKNIAGKGVKVYRYRSDEFVIWHPDLPADDVLSRSFTLLYDCREPLFIGNSAFEVSCSIGVACFPEHGHHPEMLIRNAENAMHRAKKLRLGVQIYNERLAYNSTIKVTLRSQLRSALHNKEFVLHYQPKVEIGSGRLAGAEAIVRWQHPEEGLLQPSLFIDLVEQSGIIHAFTRYTVEMAVNQIKTWSSYGFELPVSVNLSAYNLMDSAFIPFVRSLLEKSGIKPALLEFELTESATMVDIAVSRRVLSDFREMGIATSIDDFGTGMSSFAYLRELDIHTVKLDQSFIRGLAEGNRDAKIVEGIVSLCRNLGIDVIAEGVETQQQASLLTRLDCHIAQGYLYGKPMPAKDILSVMQDGTSLTSPQSRTHTGGH
ncbi:putative bifunctional diguanylate cyclase/phosphodiesterase [Alteromonas sp. RKMC-009]|uniref:putative bifunctional diguanylate cyclase/phosphodiesterase n=1 Tax=Alteromonas sp. RKMC-009 TaxID=2267264 RepID=UPI000E69CD10|nr:bifunctional diguanylate cyclase/phosphodiesterase [Alteromonas sp. RKMC-009]AYA64109.1 GGDEF domain-containing protein [Alteromonas sp. RKMC-009]